MVDGGGTGRLDLGQLRAGLLCACLISRGGREHVCDGLLLGSISVGVIA